TALANDLKTYTPGSVNRDQTLLAITSPLVNRTVRYGNRITISGTLQSSGAVPIANRRVFFELLEGRALYFGAHAQTNSTGEWSITLKKQLRRNLIPRVIFPGSDAAMGVTRKGHHIYVVPMLGARSSTRSAHRGSQFTFKGSSQPNMHGARVSLQVRRSAHGSWRTVGSVAVNRRRGYSKKVSFATPGAAYLRWHYAGGKSKAWMSAASPSRRVSIT